MREALRRLARKITGRRATAGGAHIPAPMNSRRRRARRALRSVVQPMAYPPCAVCGEFECEEHCPWCAGCGFNHADDCPTVLNVYPVGRWEEFECAACPSVIIYGESYSYVDFGDEWRACCLGCAARSELGIGFT